MVRTCSVIDIMMKTSYNFLDISMMVIGGDESISPPQ